MITYTGHWGLFVARFEGDYKVGGVEAHYTSTEPISGWASVAGGNNTVLHKVRTLSGMGAVLGRKSEVGDGEALGGMG